MAFCRFSSDNFTCDVYVYESKDGIVIHVASNKLVGNITPLPSLDDVSMGDYVAAINEQTEAVRNAERRPIGGVFDGECFTADTYQEAVDLLNELASSGYRIPDWLCPLLLAQEDELE